MPKPRSFFTLALLLLTASEAFAATDPYPRNPNVDVQRYVFLLSLSDASDVIVGETVVEVKFLAAGEREVVLDLVGQAEGSETGMTVTAVTDGAGNAVTYRHEADRLHLQLAQPSRKDGEQTFVVSYQGIPGDGLIIAQNKYGDRTFFGDNWPNRARHWIPAVDHPSDKAINEFVVTAPDHYQVVGSGELVEETNLDDGLRLTHWRSLAPLPTKVMVIGVARFAVQHIGEFEGVPVQSWVYPQDREAGFFDYALAGPILKYFEDRLGPFPYAKLANVQSKTRYGGMENASNIFYHENSINGSRGSEGLLAHEIAHQWFGDAVTERDWHHIWLSEGFATYLTILYLEETYGRERLVDELARDAVQIISFYQRNPAPIVDTTIVDLNRLLSANSYQKGGWVLHMLRNRIGDDAFWQGLANFYTTYQHGNALSEDFEAIMEAASGQDLTAFFQQWLYQPGHPQLTWAWRYDERRGEVTLDLTQTQTDAAFTFPLEVALVLEGRSTPQIETLDVDETTESVTFSVPARPTAVELDPATKVLFEATRQE